VVTEALDENGYNRLGFITLAALYITFALVSPFTTPLIAKLGAKRSMWLGSFWYFWWVIAGLFPLILGHSHTSKVIVWVIMVVAGMINGFGGAVLWIGQGKYVTECSTPQNKGFHFGIFWSVLMLSQILGSAISAFLLHKFSQKVFFATMGVVSLWGFWIFLTLTKPVDENIDLDEIEGKQSLLSNTDDEFVEDDKDTSSMQHIKLNETPQTNLDQIKEEGHQYTFMSTLRLFATVKMIKVIQFMLITGFVLAYFATFLPKLIANTVPIKSEKLSKSLYWMIVLGVGEVIGGFLHGKIIDKTSNKFGVFFAMCVLTITVGLTIYTHSRQSYDFLWFFVAFGGGLWDSIFHTSIGAIWGSQFDNDIEPFAIFKFIQSFAVFVFLVIEGNIKNADQIWAQRGYLLAGGIYGIFAWIITMTIDWKKVEKRRSSQLKA
jgi:MFS family permease